MKRKSFISLMVLLVVLSLLVGCDNISKNTNTETNLTSQTSETPTQAATEKEENTVKSFKPSRDANRYAKVEQNPIATIEMEDGGTIKLELYPKIAPESVENFIELAQKGFYDGLIFHRVIPKFMAQGGDPQGTGSGGPGYSIYGEFSANGYNQNTLKHERGVLSMARSEEYNSAGSQFFIMVDNASYLDGAYAAFGRVLEGMDVVDQVVNSEVIRRDYDDDLKEILQTATDSSAITQEIIDKYLKQSSEINRPINPPVIKTITVDTFGVTYESPSKIVEE